MGKSNRTKKQRTQEVIDRQQRQIAQISAEKKLNRTVTIAVACFVAVLTVAITLFFSINSLLDNGYFMRKKIAVSSKNYEVNNSMLSYFFYEEYRNFVNENYESLADINLSADKSLKKQKSFYKDGSWYDHFMNLTEQRIKELLALCEYADENGIKLSKAENAEIDYIISDKKKTAENSDYSELEYYKYMYGRGVTEKDIRACLKLEMLSEKALDKLYSNFSLSEKEYEDEFNKNFQKYCSVSALVYTFKYEDSYKSLNEKSTEQDCINAINADIIKEYATLYETDMSVELIEALVMPNMINTYSYKQDSVLDKFAFKKDAKSGDFYLNKTDEGCTVYLLKSNPQKRETATKNIHLIYSASQTYGGESYAQNFINSYLAEVNSAANKTLRIETLAKRSSEDLTSKLLGGEYKNVKTGVLEEAVEQWVFDEKRAEGDTTVIAGNEGFYLVRFDSTGLASWKADIHNEKWNNHYADYLKNLVSKQKININEKNLNKISI